MDTDFSNISWKLMDKYFRENSFYLVDHHLESYNSFFSTGLVSIFRENNPIRFIEPENKDDSESTRNECLVYLGGKDGSQLYFGKPIIYDDSSEKTAHYMYPNDARLRNMTYGITIHYDVVYESIYYIDGVKQPTFIKTDRAYLGRFPIMLQSNICILKGLAPEVRFNMGECRNDYGGYFIIDGKEKSIIPQEKFADNMIYVKKNKEDDIYSISANIRSVSEDASKPIRSTAVKMVAPTSVYTNNQIVVMVPNVKKPVPLFIIMRALGVVSDKSIIEYCLLDLEKNESYIDLFIPSIHDANKIFNQQTALEYIAVFTKYGTITYVYDILMNYFLPHIGDDNFLDKAYFVGYMVNKLLRVSKNAEKPTDRDNFRFKRIDLDGSLLYDLFREYYLIQKRDIALKIDNEYYYHREQYKNESFTDLIQLNFHTLFKDRIIESGVKKAFKGNWGATSKTKQVGLVQDLNRLSWNSFISQLRKLNLPMEPSAKVVGPRLLNSSQWGYIDPIDTPDGGNIGLHKHLSVSTMITSGFSCIPLIKWLRAKTAIRLLQECGPTLIGSLTKMFVNGNWIGCIENPIETVDSLKFFRRNGLLPYHTSVSFDYDSNEILLYTDSGRMVRPIYYLTEHEKTSQIVKSLYKTYNSDKIKDGDDDEAGILVSKSKKDYKQKEISFNRPVILSKIKTGEFTWQDIVCGFSKERTPDFNYKDSKVYDFQDMFPKLTDQKKIIEEMEKNRAIVDYIDSSEVERLFIANNESELKQNKFYTHVEIKSSLMFGVMGNQIIFPENNPVVRNSFSCGQSKQAVSLYHSNHQMRIDKMGVVLNYGQTPLIKSKYMEYFNKEEQPYGVNAVVAIMTYTGYNVEDAILINEGSIKRGLFNTTYYSMYEAREESSKIGESMTNSVFTNVMKKEVSGIKPGYDYSYLNDYGLIAENTPLNDKIVLIGQISSSSGDDKPKDMSVFPKKGQLGFVEKSFITEGEEGFRIAKIKVREERIPSIGDKMASRAGQKGTIGLIIPENDMPFTQDGIRPDMIINPHALPSRMTIGQLIESLLGKICVSYGGVGNCTAFETKGPNTKIYGDTLINAGFHSSGNQILYNGMTGDQLYSEIYIGPTYYMRLKHMVKDKINYRARGPNTMLTRQPVGGRANDGGLAIGSMERDGVIAHGAMSFLTESFMDRADEYYMAICNKTGCIAIYNEPLNLFLSPHIDGPIKYKGTIDGKINIENLSRFGRSFSIVRIPYTLKLLIQELQVMNVQMRIITESNIDQLVTMSYSNNVNKLLGDNTNNLDELFKKYKDKLSKQVRAERENVYKRNKQPQEERVEYNMEEANHPSSPEYAVGTPPSSRSYISNETTSSGPKYNPYSPNDSPQYVPYTPIESPLYKPYSPNDSPQYNSNNPYGSPPLTPYTPDESPPLIHHTPDESPPLTPHTPDNSPPFELQMPIESRTNKLNTQPPPQSDISNNPTYIKYVETIKNPNLKTQFDMLPERDKKLLLRMLEKQKQKKDEKISEIMKNEKMDILETEENKIKLLIEDKESEDDNNMAASTSISDVKPLSSTDAGEVKSIKFS